MDPARLTQKSQEALHDAQTKALRYGHSEVDGEHLLQALLEQPDGIVPRLLTQAGGDPDKLRLALEEDLSRRPRVAGPGVSPGQVNVTQRLSRLLDTADQEAQRLKDEYVSVEHLIASRGLSCAEEHRSVLHAGSDIPSVPARIDQPRDSPSAGPTKPMGIVKYWKFPRNHSIACCHVLPCRSGSGIQSMEWTSIWPSRPCSSSSTGLCGGDSAAMPSSSVAVTSVTS